jgi:hypothetical protein
MKMNVIFIYLFILFLKGLSCYTMDLRTRSGHVDCLDVRGFGDLRVGYSITLYQSYQQHNLLRQLSMSLDLD